MVTSQQPFWGRICYSWAHVSGVSWLQHTDLHPGNILVRVRPSAKAAADAAAAAAVDDILMKPIRRGQAKAQLQLVSTKPSPHPQAEHNNCSTNKMDMLASKEGFSTGALQPEQRWDALYATRLDCGAS